MNCPNCSAAIKDSGKFCGACGFVLSAPALSNQAEPLQPLPYEQPIVGTCKEELKGAPKFKGRLVIYAVTGLVILGLLGFMVTMQFSRGDGSPDNFISLGGDYLFEHDYEQALEQFLHVIELEPTNPRGYEGAARALVGLGRISDAIDILRDGISLTNDDALIALMREVIATEREREALELEATEQAYSEDILDYPPHPDAYEGSDFEGLRVRDITPDFSYGIAERFSINNHTVGWLDVPGTNISDVVVRNPECTNNLYYLRRNFYREFYFDGVYYIDIRADLGPTREYLGINTTIYGHAMTDDPEDEASFSRKFGHLHRFRNPEFMRAHPYIFFSLPGENLTFEIIAVFYGNVGNPNFSYNNNHQNPSDFIHVLENEVLPRSLFHFDTQFDESDRFLTLSTDIFNPSGGVTLLHHSESLYRFAIMGRLVDPDALFNEYATFTINENRIVDPDGFWP